MGSPTYIVQTQRVAEFIERRGWGAMVLTSVRDPDELLYSDVVALFADDEAGHRWAWHLAERVAKRCASFTPMTTPGPLRNLQHWDELVPLPIRQPEKSLTIEDRVDRTERARDKTRRELAEEAAAAGRKWGPPRTLSEALADPQPEGLPRVAGMTVIGGRTAIVGRYKSGKTTLVGNYLRSVLAGDPFLTDPAGKGAFWDVMRYPVASVVKGDVVVLNYEMPERLSAGWMADQGLAEFGDRVQLWDLRALGNPLASESGRSEVAELAAGAGLVVVDTFASAFTGRNQNDNSEVRDWTLMLDEVVGPAADLVVLAHAGHGGDRIRGASALGDWPETMLTLTREPGRQGFLSLAGRPVTSELDGAPLLHDPVTRRVIFDPAGKSRAEQDGQAQGTRRTERETQREQSKRDTLKRIEVELLAALANGPQSGRYLVKTITGSESAVKAVIEKLVTAGRVIAERGRRGGGQQYRLSESSL